MNTYTTTQGAAAGSAGFAMALSTILIWALSLKGVTVPADVATAFATVIMIGTHFLVTHFTDKDAPVNVSIPAAPVDAVIVPKAAEPEHPATDPYGAPKSTEPQPSTQPAITDGRIRPPGH